MLKYLNPDDKESAKDRFKNKKAHLKADGGSLTSETSESDAGDEDATQKSEDPDEEYLKKLHERVRRVVRGHLQWISTQTESWKDGTFAPHYWPNGRRINELEYLTLPSLIDSPLQLLKVYHILESEPDAHILKPSSDNDRDQSDWLVGDLRLKVRSWIEELHAANQRGTYTFSRKPKHEYQIIESDNDENEWPKYCLTDHVMIGMAVGCVEKLIGLKMPTKEESPVSPQQALEDTAQPPNEKQLWCYYTYDKVRTKTLKRFTVGSTGSSQRIFATSRWSDRTRFLLHSKDTYLFFAANMEYFNVPKILSSRKPKGAESPKLADVWRHADERWTKLLDAQSKYDEFQHPKEKPLWYAIPFVLGNMGKPVNEKPLDKPAKMPHSILLEPSWYNGLFPGRLGKENQPAIHEDEDGRDEFWFSTFELPNILWTFGSAEDTMKSGKPVEKHTTFVNLSHPKDKIEPKIVLDDWLQEPPAILSFMSEPDSVPPQDTTNQTKDKRDKEQRVKKILDKFDNKLPQSPLGVVIDVPRYSLGYEMATNQITEAASFALKTQRTIWESKKRIIWLSVRNRDVAKTVYEATRGIEKENVLAFLRRNSNFNTYFHDSATAALNVWETELHLSFFRPSQSEGEILDRMKGTRLASTTMSLRFSGDFSDRYWTCYFLEHGTHDRKKKAAGERVTQDGNTVTLGLRLIPREEDCIIAGDLDLKLSVQDLVQAFEELRWTGRDFEQASMELGYSVPDLVQALKDVNSVQDLGPAVQRLGSGEIKIEPGMRRKLRADAKRKKEHSMFLRAWQQRRVLELLIYSKILQELHRSTTQVLQLIKRLALQSEQFRGLGSKTELFTTAVDEARQLQKVGVEHDYDSIASQWREYAQILVVVEENLTDNIERIEQWENREKDRQNEQPRWTDQDKRNHTATILRLAILCKRQATEIDRLKRDVITFRESLPNRLETIRNDIAFRDSQNINLFTYVTVVFLPLGFAAGILSMNGAPDHHLLMNLVTLSLGALGITLFILLNAQIIKILFSPLVHGYRALTQDPTKSLSQFMKSLSQSTEYLWQFTKYTFFYTITKRAMTSKSERQTKKRVLLRILYLQRRMSCEDDRSRSTTRS
jgi:hypothetical protein